MRLTTFNNLLTSKLCQHIGRDMCQEDLDENEQEWKRSSSYRDQIWIVQIWNIYKLAYKLRIRQVLNSEKWFFSNYLHEALAINLEII